MSRQYSLFILFLSSSYLVYYQLAAQQLSQSPRLCAFRNNPSQYYPCALDSLGLNSWSFYRCPDETIFDEILQQCSKTALSDLYPSLSSTDDAQLERISNFIVSHPVSDARRLITDFEDPFSIKKFLHERVERAGGIFWSNGQPLMELDEKSIFDSKSSINSKLNYFSYEHPYPPPVSEDELKYKKICYFTNWAQYRSGSAKFEPEHIDPFLCTHIIYAFAYISNETFLIRKVEDNDEDLYRRVNALKKRNPKLKTILGVGGWNMKSYAFSIMVHDSAKRKRFIFDTINFLHKHNFDGFEVDWEYPGIRGGLPDDKYYLTIFFQEFKEAAIAQSIVTGQPRLLMAAAVAANAEVVSNGYEIDKIAKILDFINIMTYDFHGAWQNHTGLNAPLYRRFDETGPEAMLNQVKNENMLMIIGLLRIFFFEDFGVAIWLKSGAPAHKLVLGIPLFARTFLLAHADQNELRSPTIGNGTEGPYTRSAGFLSYFEVCLLQSDPQWTRISVPDGSESEYMYKNRDWIAYDTLSNIQKRAAYVVANNLGGLFVWSLDMDDFNGIFCSNGTYPFIRNSLSLLPANMASYI
ncbi:unnamed protein product [Adineta ricciae]|uniref:GH18 domain-containing protein n=1 Tax=Adineta ricciae TaxID=249248 RepID=A0A814D0C8_ADIRI|nr:unnamed protein product [Adineta ricciae]CAF1069474.1 unnamed protein product [Adineta ricciae]